MELKKNLFPDDFIFGTATSSYQIEGSASSDGRLPSIWDDYTHNSGKIKDGSTGDIACDHYRLYKSDISLIKKMGLGAYRFSTSWSRVLRDRNGATNSQGLDYYDRLIDTILEEGLEPFITLYHWDLPMYLEEKGGWLNRDTAYAFSDYSSLMVENFGDRVQNWITHNEMWCSSFLSYHLGEFAPGIKDLSKALTVSHNILLSHGLAVSSMRDVSSSINIGIAPNYLPSYAASSSDEDKKAAHIYDGYFNRWFLDPLTGRGYPEDMKDIYKDLMPAIKDGDLDIIAAPIDFIGVNYYNANWYAFDESIPYLPCRKVQPEDLWFTADRDVYAPGLYDTLKRLAEDYRFQNIYITENGAAFDDKIVVDNTGGKAVHDEGRIRFLKEHFQQAAKAVHDGIPLKGYFIWSLMDNFEWTAGYSLRYGLHFTDFTTQERIPKDSALWLKGFMTLKS